MKTEEWLSKIGAYLAGRMTEAELLKAAENSDKKKDGEQHCEAYFYAGTMRLIAGDKTGATDFLERCVATGVEDFMEYRSAVAELKTLKGEK